MQISSTYTEDTTKSDLIAKTDTKEYTADELYNELVTSYGLSNGISIIDTKILEKKFSVDDKAIKEMIDEFKVQLGTNYYAYMQQYGLTNDQEIYDYFKLAQLQDAPSQLNIQLQMSSYKQHMKPINLRLVPVIS